MIAKRPPVFSEQTLVPVSLVVTFLGLAAWVGNVSARADDGSKALDKVMLHLDQVVESQSELKAKVSGIDAKVDMLLHRAAIRRELETAADVVKGRPH